MSNVRQVERYGATTMEDAEMDAARKAHCLCLRCDRLDTVNARNNCPMAAVMFSLCVAKGMAVGVSRCQDFTPKMPRCTECQEKLQGPTDVTHHLGCAPGENMQ